jgi:hypothetical protein
LLLIVICLPKVPGPLAVSFKVERLTAL